MEFVKITRKGRVAIVSFDRGSSSNALSCQLMRELTDAARRFEEDHETSAVVLTGRADNFCLGYDLKDAEALDLRNMPLAQRRIAVQTGARMCRAWEDIQPLTICAIEGWCVGGGVALAVSTDLRLVAEGSNLYVPEVERGLNMSWGSIPRITNLVGPARAKRMIVLAERLSAHQAIGWGLADEQAPDGTVLDAALDMAQRAAAMPPVALRMCKQGINAYANALAHSIAHSDFDQFALALASEDADEGIESFFGKRAPKFTGR